MACTNSLDFKITAQNIIINNSNTSYFLFFRQHLMFCSRAPPSEDLDNFDNAKLKLQIYFISPRNLLTTN